MYWHGVCRVRRHSNRNYSERYVVNSALCEYRALPSRAEPSRATCAVQVIAIDIDATRLEMARHNARVYGVSDAIEFIQACEPAGHSHTEEVRLLRRLTD